MKKSDIEFMKQFEPGQAVKIKDANFYKDVIGKTAIISKVIKTKMELMVTIPDGFIPCSEVIKAERIPEYKPQKHFVYYPSAKNVEILPSDEG